MKKRKKKVIKLNLYYTDSKYDVDSGVAVGKVADPKYLKELILHVEEDYAFNMEDEIFEKTGRYVVEISGSNRALKQLGAYLINLATYKTKDPDYHDHFDGINGYDDKELTNLIIRKQ